MRSLLASTSMYRTRRFILLLLCLAASALRAIAGPGDFYLQHYDNRNGLSNSSINQLFSDASNLLWVATWDGLNLYNGSSFHVFNYSRESDVHSVGSNVIRQVTEDQRGNTWITTIEGISRYARPSGRFYHYFYSRRQSRVSESEYALAVDTAGTVYCFNKKNGLSRYDATQDRFRSCALRLPPGSSASGLFFDAYNRLWLLGGNGELHIYDGTRFEALSRFETIRNVNHIFKAGGQTFYTTFDNRLFSLGGADLQPRELMKLPSSLSAIGFYRGHYLLAWTNKGCGMYTPDFQADNFLGDQLQNLRITSFAIGSEEILWCGTDGSGIIKVYPKTKPFGTISTSDNGLPYNRSVRAFCRVGNDLWVGTKGSGIIVMNGFWPKGDSAQRRFITAPLDNNSVYALKERDGFVFIGTDGKGLGVYDERSGKFHQWSHIQGSASAPDFGSVYAIDTDPDGSLWLGTSGYGLVHLRIDRGKNGLVLSSIERFPFRDDNTGPANDIIYALQEDGDDLLWIGCRYGGLSLLDKRTRTFRSFKAFTYDGSLSNNDVLSLFKDGRNRLWIGTSYGLNWLELSGRNLSQPRFRKLTMEDGLPNNTIHAIEQDSSGTIWMSSNKGLASINGAGQISYYQQADGLQSNEFSDGAAWKDAAGLLYFGGIYGFNSFLPREIRRSAWRPALQVEHMLIGDKQANGDGYLVLKDLTSTDSAYTVSRKLNYFELDIHALSYLNAEKCEYAWYLQGYDKQWRYGGTNGRINYTNLLPGDYVLRVKWSNGEGIWSADNILFRLEVKQYIWLRWYALLFYLLVTGALAYIIYSYRRNKQVARQQLELEHLLREKDEAAHQSRIGFFTNIAHELQTPLTLIMGSAERFMDKKPKSVTGKEGAYFLSLIYQQASKLTYLVHQLLDFRKAEAGYLVNHYAFLDLSELLQNLAEAFVPLGEKKGMEYEIRIESGITGWADKDKLEKVMYNLLSNAFRHATHEQISFTAAYQNDGRHLEIAVTNPCRPMNPDELAHLFDQFYTGQQEGGTEHFGSGIGLAFTRQLVGLMQGTITCSYEAERITFRLLLPLQQTGLAAIPHQQAQIAGQPSTLYRTIIESELAPLRSAEENNKSAVIDQVQEKDRKNILLVEDDAHIRYLLRDILQDDYIIHEATDGLEAIGLIGKIMPDLVICDVMMPNLNGLELCSRVKNAPATCHVPFLILSARGTEDHRMEGYEVGADAYVAKPFQASHLKMRVKKLIEYRQKLLSIFNGPEAPETLADTELPNDDKVFLARLSAVIEEHLTEPELNAVFLERHFNLSKMQLYRKLKTMTGMTPGEFIRNTRLRQAATLLTSTSLNVTEIFYRTGFNNQSYFFREFRKKYGAAPAEYRERRNSI